MTAVVGHGWLMIFMLAPFCNRLGYYRQEQDRIQDKTEQNEIFYDKNSKQKFHSQFNIMKEITETETS